MIKPIFIRTARAVSAQDSFNSNDLLQPGRTLTGNRFTYMEPNYQDYFTIMQLRRMSRITRLGLVTAIECLRDAGDYRPEAIIMGTGKGSLTDTEKFIHAVREFAEGTLNPTPFIQSTYNSLNGLIGLHHHINSYNSTYVHTGFSLEHALLDAAFQLNEQSIQTALVGSFEEMTPEHYIIKDKLDFWKKEIESPDAIMKSSPGAISGEGSFFFFLDFQQGAAPLQLVDLTLVFEPGEGAVLNAMDAMLEQQGLGWDQLDVYLSGRNQDSRYEHYYAEVENQLSEITHQLHFKHLSGEFDTAAGFGLWAAVRMAEKNQLFPSLIRKQGSAPTLNYMLLYNQYYGKQHSIYLLKKT
ncbi:MAG: beta-ketoacyl synthase chain length factor [Flavihumibacter sp.]|nr:beta-ketoacyl synthase chain length factor [Flavihumibacter sp.]